MLSTQEAPGGKGASHPVMVIGVALPVADERMPCALSVGTPEVETAICQRERLDAGGPEHHAAEIDTRPVELEHCCSGNRVGVRGRTAFGAAVDPGRALAVLPMRMPRA